MRSDIVLEPIAIIGIGCAFPGARGPNAFWELLRNGRDATREIPPERFDINRYHDPTPGTPGKILTRRGGFIENIDMFEPGFFGISPREAANMDPQQRLLLEVAWEAIEDAGLTRAQLGESTTGVFIGVSSSDYSDMQLHVHDSSSLDVYTLPGTARSILAGRISHSFDLKGPSIAIDTACSSSLVAAHLACQSLWSGECNMALVGGVNIILTPESWSVLSLARIISPEGRAKVFDARANGFVRGEGAGIAVLKPLLHAQADGDPIYAVIRGSAINNDGHNSSVMTPNQQAQESVLRAAYRHAHIKPYEVHYVEAHGTGTSVGDPIEARALGTVLAEGRDPGNPCLIGSVKTNIGHLEAGAGIAGLIKVALCLKHRAIPPSLHFEHPNPAIPWSEIPLAVQQEYCDWPVSHGTAIAGVSSFGISGTNVHMVLSDAVPTLGDPVHSITDRAYLLPISARTPTALAEAAMQFHDFLTSETSNTLHDVCYSASVRRTHSSHRFTFVACSREELIEQIKSQYQSFDTEVLPAIAQDSHCGPVFVFSGQGAKFWPIDSDLLARFPVFRETVLRCDELLHQYDVDWSLVEQLTATGDSSRLYETDVCQVAIFACQVALAALWKSWGIQPAAVIGHSLGEVAAAHVAGAISLAQAIKIVFHRGRITKQASGKGAMALVGLPMSAAADLTEKYGNTLAVAVNNSPNACVLSGDPTLLSEVLSELEQQHIFVRRLAAIDYAAHSPQMEPLKHELAWALADLNPQETQIPLYSTVTSEVIQGTELNADYWADNLREPVRFYQTLQQVLTEGYQCFLEVHPTQVLIRPIQEVIECNGCEAFVYPSLHRDADGERSLLRTLGHLYCHGYPVDWGNLYPTGGLHVRLPTTPWQRQRCWLSGIDKPDHDALPFYSEAIQKSKHPLLTAPIQSAAQPDTYIVQTEVGRTQPSYLADHQVHDTTIFPAAAYVEMAFGIAHTINPSGKHIVTEFSFEKALILPEKGVVTVQVSVTVGKGTITLAYYSYSSVNEHASWTCHANGTIQLHDERNDTTEKALPITMLQQDANVVISGVEHYQAMATQGLNYGPSFQGIEQLWVHKTEALAKLDLSEQVRAEASAYHIHPVLLDVAFQSVAALLHVEHIQQVNGVFLPVALKSVQSRDSLQGATYAHVVLHPLPNGTQQRVTADICLLDHEGRVLVEVKGLVLQQLTMQASSGSSAIEQSLYQLVWQLQPLPTCGTPTLAQARRWLIIGDKEGFGYALSNELRIKDNKCILISTNKTKQDFVDLACLDSVQRLIATYHQPDAPLKGILYLSTPNVSEQEETCTATGENALTGLLHLVQALAQRDGENTPRLWIVTRGVQSVTEADFVTLNQASLWGLARTIALEFPRFRCSCVDLSTNPESVEVTMLGQEIAADGVENQIVYRAQRRWVARLDRFVVAPDLAQRQLAPAEAFRLESTAPGILDNLALSTTERLPPEPDQVEIRVHSASLNFLDVLSALGLRPDQTNTDLILGMECAGTVTQVGDKVTHLHVGDEVLAVAPYSIGNYTRTVAKLAISKPAHWSFQDAATVPIAYLTAYYALHTLGRLSEGERILIHSAAGGVGLAAVYIAQQRGAEIYATAGSPEKRAFLRELGVHYVMDSRTLLFADEVMSYTNGEGVDLVLNSLAGEAIPKSLTLLRANGRFLEIGKRDIYSSSKLDMSLLKKNIAFFAIDLIPLLAKQPAFCAELLESLVQMLAEGALPPLPYTEFPITQAVEAFRYMAQAKQIGKIVIQIDSVIDENPLFVRPRSRALIRNDRTYLITGGLGGLGICLAHWLVEKGARHLLLVSRSAPTTDVDKILAALESQGASIITFQADVSCAADVESILKHIEDSMPPLCGLFHAAGVLDDGMLTQLNEERIHRVMAPKAEGAWLLHKMTCHLDLDLFVLFSSATSILGSPGQGNYAAANAFLDRLAVYRQRQGLPALSINWGAWSTVGMVAQQKRAEHLAQQGIMPFAPQQGIQMLERILATPATQVTAMNVEWDRLLQRFMTPLLKDLAATIDMPRDKTRSSSGLRQQLQSLPAVERQRSIVELLQKQLAHVLRTPVHNLTLNQPLSELGVDSLMMVELVNRIEAELGVTLPMSTLLQSPTIANLSELMVKLLEPTVSGTAVSGIAEQSLRLINEDVVPDERFALPVTELANEVLLDSSFQIPSSARSEQVAISHIFLTGSTGFVGTFLLHDLLCTTKATIYCLIRTIDSISGHERLIQTLKQAFPSEELALERIVCIPGNLTEPKFGLSPEEFDALAERIDLIIHSGAEIKWLASYTQLKQVNVNGTQTIIELAAHRRLKPLHYVSSLAIFPIVEHSASVIIEEDTPLDHGGILYGGYAQSKWVAEKVVKLARERGLPATIYRPSLVVGHSQTGTWQGNHVIINMLRSWIEIGMAPDLDAYLDLVPVDYTSQAIVQLAICEGSKASSVYHLNNSQTVSVREMVDWLIECGYRIRRMPYPAWRNEMLKRGDIRRQAILDSVGPLLALQVSEDAEWLAHLPHYSNQYTQQALNDLSCPLVDATMFRTYVEYLKQSGSLPYTS